MNADLTCSGQPSGSRIERRLEDGMVRFAAGYNASVFERVLQRMRVRVRNRQYVMTVHA